MSNQYEKLGAFYLGKEYDLTTQTLKKDIVLYDSKDLTTHAVIIGMTGSGKTGLGIGLLEEALIDNIPIIAIDPKGDLPNLLLNFPEMKSSDFRPWINEQDAINKGLTPEKYATQQAELWKKGLESWGQKPERVERLQNAAQFTVFTPGSSAGKSVSVLRNFSPPPPSVLADTDLFREKIQTTTTGLLALLGIQADPITSKEHILIANILENTWKKEMGLDLTSMIHAIQSPPFERIGVMELEFFFPAKERFTLAMRLNNLLAAPGFESWIEGEPMDIGRILYTPLGKPRASIFSISHLSDTERMFFVTMLLNEILGWMRTQPGTSSLRAILYMDEIFGYMPPVKNPPSKGPLLTLLKQARAFGLGVVLSTQNPVDLDYKGLSNTGTWFIGRLQTERDKERVLSGLEGAAKGTGFDRKEMEEILAGLGKRVFLLHNVNENEPVLFQTRWVLSYLRGPLTREQIKLLMAPQLESIPRISGSPESQPGMQRPIEKPRKTLGEIAAPVKKIAPLSPAGIETFYLSASGLGHELFYKPAIAGRLDVHYSSAKYKVSTTQVLAVTAELEDGPIPLDWDNCVEFDPFSLDTTPLPGAGYEEIPSAAKRAASYRKWNKDLLRWIRQNKYIVVYRSKMFRLTSNLNESEGEFRARLAHVAREKRDMETGKLRRKYSSRFATLKDRLIRAQHVISKEEEQAKSSTVQTAISFGTAILSAFLGRKAISSSSATRVGSAMKSASRMQKEKMDIARAQQRAESIQTQLLDLEGRLETDIDKLELSFDPEIIQLDEITIKPKSTDITLEIFGLLWLPHRKDNNGHFIPDWR